MQDQELEANRIFEKEFLKVIEAVCKTPKIFIATDSFDKVGVYLADWGAVHLPHRYYHWVFTPFLKWLLVKYKKPNLPINWDRYREIFPDNSEALKNLPILYREYIESGEE